MKLKVRKIGELTAAIVCFAQDAGDAEDALDAGDSQYKRRVFARALFAMIEGTVHFLQQTTLSTGSVAGKISVMDFVLLMETSPEIKSNGQVHGKARYIPLEDNLRFLARMMHDVYELDVDLGIGTPVWQDFQAALSIRNRITHPKSQEDFLISDTDVEIMKRVRSWFCQITSDAVSGIVSFISKHRATDATAKRVH